MCSCSYECPGQYTVATYILSWVLHVALIGVTFRHSALLTCTYRSTKALCVPTVINAIGALLAHISAVSVSCRGIDSQAIYLCAIIIAGVLGNKLMPDYFLDDAEKFRDEWVKENTPSAGSGSSMGQLFAKIQPLINAEVIASISATYKFAITEETPGKCIVSS